MTSTFPSVEQLSHSVPIADEAENALISEIYRNAARVFYFQRLRNHSRRALSSTKHPDSPGLSYASDYDFQIQYFNSILLTNLRLLPLGSAYDSSLLFPIGIAAMEIHVAADRAYVLTRIRHLEGRFQLNHFRKFREKLSAFWDGNESHQDDLTKVVERRQRFVGEEFACDAILLG
jgi:hypothetical protein